MPTVLRWNGYRFYFFSNEGFEPPHIHVDKGGNTVKLWLEDVSVARDIGFSARELAVIEEDGHRRKSARRARAFFGGLA